MYIFFEPRSEKQIRSTLSSQATKQMGEAGMIVLLEGREATVNYIPSPFRYTQALAARKTLLHAEEKRNTKDARVSR